MKVLHGPRNRKGNGTRSADMIKNANSYSSMDQRIDGVRASESDRQIAREHMRDADFVADLVCRAAETLRSVGELLNGIFANRVR